MEEFNFKYGLSVGEVVLLQVVVKSAAWRSERERRCGDNSTHLLFLIEPDLNLPEIRDATGCADPGSSHHQHPLTAALSYFLGDVLQRDLLLS